MVEPISAENFKQKNGEYVFPFELLDKTPGGSSLGRIEWHIEPSKGRKVGGRYYIEKLLVWASQTRDERYNGKIFEIPCYSESIYASCLAEDSYFKYVWRMLFCGVHKNPVFSAYPGDKHKELVINTGSSICLEINFK